MSQKRYTNIREHWKNDLIAGLSVSLVALPLSMGIALASGVPLTAGIIASVVGGIVTTFYRGSHIGINGPAAGLIVVTVAAMHQLDDGSGRVFQYVLAAYFFSGLIQVILGAIRAGKYADLFPSTVIHGMLAAIGLIIMIKQINVALGLEATTANTINTIRSLPQSFMNANIIVTLLSMICIIILVNHHKIKNKFVHFIPSGMWVLLFSIPVVYLLDFNIAREINFLGLSASIGPQHLIQLPDALAKMIIFPNFSQIHRPVFWMIVLTITLVSSIENVLSCKAVDKLDPFNRKTDYNKDFIGAGGSTMIAALIGGLPIITVIVRSSVNINHGAAGRLSNFTHGLFILLFVWLFSPVIQEVPLAALAAILIYTGYKLASPKVFRENYQKGWEQFLVFVFSLTATLSFGLLWGIFLGMVFTLFIQWIQSGLSPNLFWKNTRQLSIKTIREGKRKTVIKIRGIANFLNIISVKNALEKVDKEDYMILDLGYTRLIDNTTLEYIHEMEEKYYLEGREFEIMGLDTHQSSSSNPNALHILRPPKRKMVKLTKRQIAFKEIADNNSWSFNPEINWENYQLKKFPFFKTRPVEYRKNSIVGNYPELEVSWEFFDLTFDEGALLAREVYHTSAQLLRLPFEMPVFSLEKEEFLDRVVQMATLEDIDFDHEKDFSKRYLLKGPDPKAIRRFFSEDLIDFFKKGDIYHLESSGNELIVFRHMRLATTNEAQKMIRFSKYLVARLYRSLNDTNELKAM